MIDPSPTLTKTASGLSQPSCSRSSSIAVFLPSVMYGLNPVLRLYQPWLSAATMHKSNASE